MVEFPSAFDGRGFVGGRRGGGVDGDEGEFGIALGLSVGGGG